MISLENSAVSRLFDMSYQEIKEGLPLPCYLFMRCLSYLEEKDVKQFALASHSFHIVTQNFYLYRWILSSEVIRQKELAKEKPLIAYGEEERFISFSDYETVMTTYACNYLRKAEDYCVIEEKKALTEKRSFFKMISFKKKKREESPVKIEKELATKELFVEHLLFAFDKGCFFARDGKERYMVGERVKEICFKGFTVHKEWIIENGEDYLSIFNQSLSLLLKQLNSSREELLLNIQ